MGTKADRKVALALVSAYHEAQLAGLIEHVSEAIERYRRDELDASGVDEVIHRYSKAARELWKFCWSSGSGSHFEAITATLQLLADEGRPIDWWGEAAPRRGR
jgi:hypothetical protein